MLEWDKKLSQYYGQLETMIMEIDRAVGIQRKKVAQGWDWQPVMILFK